MNNTPSSNWSQNGEPDPHGDHFHGKREELVLGNLTDDQLANAVFIHNHRHLDVEAVLSGEPSSITLLTAAKERIRWLSRQASWPTGRITVIGEESFSLNLTTREVLLNLAKQMEWNCLPTGGFEDRAYIAFEITGIIVDEGTGQTEAVSVDHPDITQWSIYGRTETHLACALHDCDSLEDAKARALLLNKIYQ
jgi:hypothetical protein